MKILKNLQKHIILVNLVLREYQNRTQHVHKSVHAKYEHCSCQDRVMTILRPPGAKIMQNMSFVAARGCQELPGTLSGGKNPRNIGTCESKVACNFSYFLVFRVFEKDFGNLF